MFRIKLLLIDIETMAAKAYVWGLYNQNIGLNQVIQDPRMICFSAEWYDKPHGRTFKSEFHDGHEEMVKEAFRLLDEADAVIHFNGKRFDVPHLNREFLKYGLGNPSPFAQIDLLPVARKNFKFLSNKLAYVTKYLKLAEKQSTGGFDLWFGCDAGDPKSWAKMKRYSVNDTKIMRELYETFLPWISNHPNRLLYGGEGACPKCKSGPVIKNGTRMTALGAYQRFQCQGCGSHLSSGKRELGVDLRGI